MKSRFISKRWLGSLMLSMAGVFALTMLPTQAQAATQEEAVVKQLQKVISKCPDSVDQDKIKQMLMQIGFRETFKAGIDSGHLLVMERETPISLLGQPTQKLVFSMQDGGDSGGGQNTISAVLPKSAFNAVKKYRRDIEDSNYSVVVRQADDGVYVSCVDSWSAGI